MTNFKKILLITFSLVIVFFSGGCNKKTENDIHSEVDIKNKLPVRIEYRQFVYKAELTVTDNSVSVIFSGNGDFPDGFEYACDGNICKLSYEKIEKSYKCRYLPNDFLPILLYGFFESFQGNIITEGYNKDKNCEFVKRTVNESFVTFEMYEKNGDSVYNIIIT